MALAIGLTVAADEPRMCFTAHFACAADGTEQPFVIQLPAGCTPDQGQAYWVNIRKFDDIHRDARVSARHDGTGDQQTLIVQADNIDVLQAALDQLPVDREQPRRSRRQPGRSSPGDIS